MMNIANHQQSKRAPRQLSHYYNLSKNRSQMNKWKKIGHSADLENIYIEHNIHRLGMLKNHKNVVYNLARTYIASNDSDFIYGICVLQNGHVVDYVLGLSKNYEDVKFVVTLCNNEELHLVHFRDVIEDYFCIKSNITDF